MANYGDSTPELKHIQLIGPEDLSEGASTSPWVSLSDAYRAEVHIMIGDIAGATSAVTLDQAVDSSGTSTKTLGFTKYYQYGQKLIFTGRSAANFSAAETITGGSSGNTAEVIATSSDHLWVRTITGSTTWTDTETITGGASGATATVSGTGTDEDTPLEKTAGSDTFNTLAITFKHYMIPLDPTMLDADNDFDHFQLDMADAASSETQGAAWALLYMRTKVYPQQPSAIGTQKTA